MIFFQDIGEKQKRYLCPRYSMANESKPLPLEWPLVQVGISHAGAKWAVLMGPKLFGASRLSTRLLI